MKPRPSIVSTITTALAVTLATMIAPDGFAQEPRESEEIRDPVEVLWDELDEMRAQARHAEAAEIAREMLALRQADPDAKAFEVLDIEILLATMEHIASLPEDARLELAAADTLEEFGEICWDEGRFDEGMAATERQIEIRRRYLGDRHPEVAVSMNNQALNYLGVGDFARAEEITREVLEIRREAFGNEHPEVAASLSTLLYLLNAQGTYEGAEPLFQEAVAMHRKLLGDDHHDVAVSLNNYAHFLYVTGDYAGAEPLWRKALAILRRCFDGDHPEVAGAVNNLGNLLKVQGDYAEAEPLCREAVAMVYAEAEPLLNDALAIKRELLGDEHPSVATGIHNLAALHRAMENYDEAGRLFEEALAMNRKLLGDVHTDVGGTLHHLAAVRRAQGDYVGAELACSEALATWRQLHGDEHPHIVRGLATLAALKRDQGDYAGAEPLLAEAARVHDAARLRAGAGLKRATFQLSPYPYLAATRVSLGKTEEAWPAAEKALAHSLADLLIAAAERDLTATEIAREDSLNGVLGGLDRQLAAYRKAARSDTTEESAASAEETRGALVEAQAAWSAFQREIAAKYPVTEGQAFSLERVQSVLSDEAAIIGWLDVGVRVNESESWCYVIRNEGPVMWAQAGSPSEEGGGASVFDQARSFRSGLSRPEFWNMVVAAESRELWSDRIAPLAHALDGVKDLVVLSSGAMVGVPVEALLDDDGVFVGERYSVSYAPSATIYTWLREGAESGSGSDVLLVGDPPFNEAHLAAMEGEGDVLLASDDAAPGYETLRDALAGSEAALAALPRLAATRDEVAAVAGVCGTSSLLLGADASEQALVRLAESGALRDFGTIHVATHALVSDERPERSALVLSQVGLPDPLECAASGSRIYDGLVTAEEIVREWDLAADLVTLSACETGLGKEVTGEGYVGFAHAFLQAGARSLLVSLWKVEDRATALLMGRFYEDRFGTYDDERGGRRGAAMSEADALQEAKHWLRTYTDERGERPYEHPYYWSAFVLIGDRV